MEVLARTSPGGLQSNLPPTVRLLSKLKQVSHGFVYWALKTVMSGESWTSLGNALQSCTCCTAFLLLKLLLRCGISLFWHCLPLWRIWLSHFCHSPSSSCVLLLASLLLSQAKQTRFPDLSLYNLQSCPRLCWSAFCWFLSSCAVSLLNWESLDWTQYISAAREVLSRERNNNLPPSVCHPFPHVVQYEACFMLLFNMVSSTVPRWFSAELPLSHLVHRLCWCEGLSWHRCRTFCWFFWGGFLVPKFLNILLDWNSVPLNVKFSVVWKFTVCGFSHQGCWRSPSADLRETLLVPNCQPATMPLITTLKPGSSANFQPSWQSVSPCQKHIL